MSRPRWVEVLRDPGLGVLALLPLLLLTLESSWIYSGPYRDAWIYYGYFQSATYYLQVFQDFYYSSRLAVILPGYLIHYLLPTLAANLVLHLGLYWVAVLSFYLVAKELAGARAALLAGIALGCHPYFLQAIGSNYVDGFGIAYFLVALFLLTVAARSPRPRLLLVMAGAVATLIVSTNLFYAIYLPLLAGHFVVLRRERGQDRLLGAALWAGLGATGLLVLLGFLTALLGGSFYYLGPSVRFITDSIGSENPFRDPSYAWLPNAVWLAFPGIAVLGSAVFFWRLRLLRPRKDPPLSSPSRGPLLWSQIQLLALSLAMLLLQVAGDTAVLQYSFSASLLLPVAFLAFAGQISGLVADLPARQLGALAAVVGLLQLVPPTLPRLVSPDAPPFSSPLLVALLAGLGSAMAPLGWARARRAAAFFVLLVFLSLGLSQVMVRQTGGAFWLFALHGGDGRGLFLQMDRGVRAIESADPSQNLRLWYDLAAEEGRVYDALASAFLLCSRMVSGEFPNLHGGRMCDGVQLGPNMQIAILSADPAAFEKARAALAGIGLSTRLLRRERIAGPSRGFTITYIGTGPGTPP